MKLGEEVYTYNEDDKLPSAFDINGKAKRIDKWWMEVQRLDKYPNICKMVFALLSCFSCPVVESSFSIMGNVMDETTTRLNIESLNAIQTIKYWLSAKNQSAIETFQKEDYIHEAVGSKLAKNMNEVAKAMKEANQELNKKNVSMTSLGITPPLVISKKKSLKCLIEVA